MSPASIFRLRCCWGAAKAEREEAATEAAPSVRINDLRDRVFLTSEFMEVLLVMPKWS
jgi:hypothetical protein